MTLKYKMKEVDNLYSWMEIVKKDVDKAANILEEIWESIPEKEKDEYEAGSLAHKIANLMDIIHNI
jgi:hypothetical protein